MATTDAAPPRILNGPLVLPGDAIDSSQIPANKKKPLRLGPGLRHVPPAEIVPTVAGQLVADRAKNTLWVEYNGGRYVPSAGDLVIGQVHHSSADFYHVLLTPHTALALLPTLSFESATKKTRPVLPAGSLVYARVALADRHMDAAELECVSPATGRADGLGPLAGGTVVPVSRGFARRLLMGSGGGGGSGSGTAGVVVLEELGSQGLAFETAVGRNGRVWVNSESVGTVVVVGRALRETDEGNLGVEAQKKMVRKLVKEMS
ncbi:Exosome complex component RRP40 [Pleurostoma richardsiae]|uniref:Ribosomal RNA-processing protein 40 n=1 Tax=Pleurostoma richardsiae TaxID=41990 RepID=A0AA38S3A1_9PEZI|nr:Exosome complex component RRP40 [Pleurostoma richardsiae]